MMTFRVMLSCLSALSLSQNFKGCCAPDISSQDALGQTRQPIKWEWGSVRLHNKGTNRPDYRLHPIALSAPSLMSSVHVCSLPLQSYPLPSIIVNVLSLLSHLTAQFSSSRHTLSFSHLPFGPLLFGVGPSADSALPFHHTCFQYRHVTNTMEAMDATRARDGRQVMFKKVSAGSELEISQFLSSPGLIPESHNHCIPLLDILELPGEPDQKLTVKPFLRAFDKPRFQTYGGFMSFFSQICDVRLGTPFDWRYRHKRIVIKNSFLRDCTANTIMLDPSGMYPKGFHPIQINRRRDFRGRAKRPRDTT